MLETSKSCKHSKFFPHSSCSLCSNWAMAVIDRSKAAAVSGTTIYTYAFVSSTKFSTTTNDRTKKNDDGHDDVNGNAITVSTESVPLSNLLLFVLISVSLFIQIVIPIAIFETLPAMGGATFCPRRVNLLTKLISFVLSVFFVILTINICVSKLRGLAFLRLFAKVPSYNRFYADLGMVSNMISIGVAATAQYYVFIRNANEDYVLLLLQSLAMQFVLTADQRLLSDTWTSWTKTQVGILTSLITMDQDDCIKQRDGQLPTEDYQSDRVLNETTMKKVRLIFVAEAGFLAMLTIAGTFWAIILTYCL